MRFDLDTLLSLPIDYVIYSHYGSYHIFANNNLADVSFIPPSLLIYLLIAHNQVVPL